MWEADKETSTSLGGSEASKPGSSETREQMLQFKSESQKRLMFQCKVVRQESFPLFVGELVFLFFLGLQLIG